MDNSYAVKKGFLLPHQLATLVAAPAEFGPRDEGRNFVGPGEAAAPYHPHHCTVDMDFYLVLVAGGLRGVLKPMFIDHRDHLALSYAPWQGLVSRG
ncbi:hypothetical protein V3F56_04005 [Moorellaceae bacterium AZ2]